MLIKFCVFMFSSCIIVLFTVDFSFNSDLDIGFGMLGGGGVHVYQSMLLYYYRNKLVKPYTLTTALPRFSPLNNPRKASNIFSNPSVTVSAYFNLPYIEIASEDCEVK